MIHYKTLLVAHDFSPTGNKAFRKALELAQLFDAPLHVIHVVEYLMPLDTHLGMVSPFEGDLTEVLLENARKRLHGFARDHGIDDDHCHIELGSPKNEIVNKADALKASLIIVGSHGRHGLGLLLGSTASGVVNHAHCDVLAIRHGD